MVRILFIGALLGSIVVQSSLNPGRTNDEDSIVGEWLTEEQQARVKIFREEDSFVGEISWLENPTDDDGNPLLDINNPDPSLRDRPIEGLRILYGFTYDGDSRWIGGRVYDPESGNVYRGRLRLVDDETLRLRGYVGIAAFGRTEVWTRAD